TYSLGRGSMSMIPLDDEQQFELLMTLGQSLLGLMFLMDLRLRWWEASGLFGLWLIQFAFSPVPPGPGIAGFIATHIHRWVTIAYFVWAAVELVRTLTGRRHAAAFRLFAGMWKHHIQRSV